MAVAALGVFGLSSGDLASIGRPDKTKWLCVLSINSVISKGDQDYKDDLVWEPEDCDALQAASEEFIMQHFHDQSSLAIHANRSYVSPNDARFSSHLSSADRFIKMFPPKS
jgi:hypothetical protein